MRREALIAARNYFASFRIDDAGLEAETILRHLLDLDRAGLYRDLNQALDPEQVISFHKLLARRAGGVPLAYLIGHREFYSLDFAVNRDVLIPRPETELLVEKALEAAANRRIGSIADIGTGSGIIAVTLALKLPSVRLYAVDISERALAVARRNAVKHGVTPRITFLEGDLVLPLPESCDLILANLPYVKQIDIIAPIDAEPRLALNGGLDGLEVISRFCRVVKNKLNIGGCVMLEIGHGQSEAVRELLKNLYHDVEITFFPDLAGIERVVMCKFPRNIK